jgi:hypothetical protein
MTGKSKDPKQARITIRIPVKDRDKLQIKALEQHASIGALVRALITKGLREKPEGEEGNGRIGEASKEEEAEPAAEGERQSRAKGNRRRHKREE